MDCVSLTRQIVWRKFLTKLFCFFHRWVQAAIPGLESRLSTGFSSSLSPVCNELTTLSAPYLQTAVPTLVYRRLNLSAEYPIPVWFEISCQLMPAHDFFSFYFVSCKILWIFLGFLYSREVELPSFSLSSYISGPHSSSRRRLITLTFSSTLLFSRLDIWTGDVATKPACLRPYRSALARRFFSGNASPCQF
jgi:hypothetical protein